MQFTTIAVALFASVAAAAPSGMSARAVPARIPEGTIDTNAPLPAGCQEPPVFLVPSPVMFCAPPKVNCAVVFCAAPEIVTVPDECPLYRKVTGCWNPCCPGTVFVHA